MYLHAYAMCQSMFCAFPCPWRIWDPKAKDKMLMFLPLIGLELGTVWLALAIVCRALCLPAVLRGLVLSIFPFLATGFMHLDGFMDVTDAVRSWRDLERRREILKDSHVGSFAVIGVAIVLLAQFACATAAPDTADARILLLLPAVSRCCSALAVAVLPPMPTSQYAEQPRSARHIAALLAQMLALVLVGIFLCGKYALVLAACVGAYALALLRAYRSLRGMNGDISGYALTLAELCGLAVYALIP